MNLDAVTKENVPNQLSVEFKRRVRISVGNFQNLSRFASCLWPPFSSLSFAFLSHKVIRWFGPVLILMILITNFFLFKVSLFYQISFYLLTLFFILPVIDLIMRKINIHVVFLRFVTHFFAMNAGLFTGLVKYITGRKSNIWQPTRR